MHREAAKQEVVKPSIVNDLEVHLTNWLRLQSKFIEGVSHATIRYSPGEGASPQHYFWSRKDDDSRLECAALLDRAEKDNKGVISRQKGEQGKETKPVLIAYPVTLDDSSRLTAAISLQAMDHKQLQGAMMQLQWGMRWLGEYSFSDFCKNTEDQTPNHLELLHSSLHPGDCHKSASKLAASLAREFDCEQVSICLQEKTKLHLLALSNQPSPVKQSAIVDTIRRTFEECLDQNQTIVYPNRADENLQINRAHKELARVSVRKQLLSIPFLSENGPAYGAILFERAQDLPFSDRESRTLQHLTGIAGSMLRLQHNSERSLIHLTIRRFKEKISKNILFISPFQKTLYLLLLLGFLGLLISKGEFNISAEATVAGKIQRVIIAPFPGYIAQASHSTGDKVKKGTILALLDTDELTLEQLKWASLKAEKELEYRRAMAENLTAPAKIMLEQKKQAEIQLALLEMQKQRTSITAPFDGLLVKGDLSQRIGSPVDRGQILFEIVPNEPFRIHLEVDEKDIGFLAVGQKGNLIVNALPSQKFQFTVDKITPVSTPQYGKNSFRVEAHFNNDSDQLNPGMKGYGKIVVAKKPLLWIWTRPIRNRLRLLLWSSTP